MVVVMDAFVFGCAWVERVAESGRLRLRLRLRLRRFRGRTGNTRRLRRKLTSKTL